MSSIVRSSVVSAEPVSLTDMKNILKIPDNVTRDDTYIKGLIKAARYQAEIITEAVLVRSNFVQYLDHFPSWRTRDRDSLGTHAHSGFSHHHHHGQIRMLRTPLVSVQSLIYIGADGQPHTLNPGQDFVVDAAKQPGRIRPIPYTVWPLTLPTPNAIAIAFTAGYAPNSEGISGGQAAIAEPETITQALNPSWQPNSARPQYSFLIDQNGSIEVQTAAGSPQTGAGPNPPAWAAIGQSVVDNGCTWMNVGPLRGFWAPDTQYAGNWVILDTNGNLQLLLLPNLTSQTSPAAGVNGSTTPPWSKVLGATTLDNAQAAWRCLGPYSSLGNQGLAIPAAPEQQAAYTIDWTLPESVWLGITQLVSHWYFNREPVTAGSATEIPLHVSSLLATVELPDYYPDPDHQ